jgi:signal peptidase I
MTSTSEIIIDNKPVSSYTIEKNYLFVLGDNLNHSYDSRYWGFLPEENIIGKAMMVYWSRSQLKPSRGFSGFLSSIRWNRIGRFVD